MTHLREHLLERLHLDAVEDALGDVGVARDQRPDVGERGDPGAAVGKITRAMDLLAALAGHADAAEGAMMRAMAERFRQALARGALGQAKETADVMRARSGSVLAPKKPR